VATTIITALLTLGAIARITRFIVDDLLFQPVRTAVDKHRQHHKKPGARRVYAFLADLMGCSWCTSIWVSAAAAVAHWLWHDLTAFLYVTGALTASHVVALAASWLDAPPPPRQHELISPIPIILSDKRR
jgi:hypothetical protein